MKNPFSTVFVLLGLLAGAQAGAQTSTPPLNQPDYNKPRVFADLPERIPFRTADAEALLNLPVGATINVTVATGFVLKGTVVSKSAPGDASVKSVVVKSAGRGNAVFTFARIQKADGSVVYRGRMLGKNAGDALELAKEGDVYVLRKKAFYDLLNE